MTTDLMPWDHVTELCMWRAYHVVHRSAKDKYEPGSAFDRIDDEISRTTDRANGSNGLNLLDGFHETLKKAIADDRE